MMLTKNKIKKINKEGCYWAEGPVVMGNYGDIDTFTFCMCRNHAEAKAVASGLNVLDWNEMHEEHGDLVQPDTELVREKSL
jgi:hypothetical protein